jgi:hypothetical protein
MVSEHYGLAFELFNPFDGPFCLFIIDLYSSKKRVCHIFPIIIISTSIETNELHAIVSQAEERLFLDKLRSIIIGEGFIKGASIAIVVVISWNSIVP